MEVRLFDRVGTIVVNLKIGKTLLQFLPIFCAKNLVSDKGARSSRGNLLHPDVGIRENYGFAKVIDEVQGFG